MYCLAINKSLSLKVLLYVQYDKNHKEQQRFGKEKPVKIPQIPKNNKKEKSAVKKNANKKWNKPAVVPEQIDDQNEEEIEVQPPKKEYNLPLHDIDLVENVTVLEPKRPANLIPKKCSRSNIQIRGQPATACRDTSPSEEEAAPALPSNAQPSLGEVLFLYIVRFYFHFLI